jgi:hypothetical protein
MKKTKKRELYSFDIEIEEEVEKDVVRNVEQKDEKTGETKTIKETVKQTATEKVPVKVFLKKPTRTQVDDGDMFYSIWLNKFIKMGLLTRAMLAKKQVDVGGTLNEDDKVNFAKLYLQLFEKQQNVIRYSAKDRDKMSNDEEERLERAVSELAVIRKQLSDFEAAQASIFDHTADVKARNKTITWFLLHLAFAVKGDGDDAEDYPLFPGTDFDEKYNSYQEADEEQDPVFVKCIDRLSTIATIWYMSGIQEQGEFEAVLEQMDKENSVDAESVADKIITETAQEKEDQPKQEAKDQPKQEAKEQPKQEAKEQPKQEVQK